MLIINFCINRVLRIIFFEISFNKKYPKNPEIADATKIANLASS
jgi:transcription termination factor NusB